MHGKRNYYEILGVPRSATPEQIKRRYRYLVRQYHPDVAKDKAAAKAAFIEITEAYQTLSNPDRRVIYDAQLDAEMMRVPPRREPPPPHGAQQRAKTYADSSDITRLFMEAERAFATAQFRTAANICRQIISIDRRHIRAHLMLGNIYRMQGRIDEAIAMYTMVLQLDPRNAEAEALLRKLARTRKPGVSDVKSIEQQIAFRIGLNLIGVSIAGILFILLSISAEPPLQALAQYLPFIGKWNTMLIAVLMINGVIFGFLLALNDWVGRIDDELVFQSIYVGGSRPMNYPIGLLLVIINFFNFYLAAFIYILFGSFQESISKSVARAFAATFILVAIAAIMYSVGRSQVLIFGGNLAFPAILIGWGIGDTFRPSW